MQRGVWELSLAELDKEIASTKKFLEMGYHKIAVDRLAILQEQREERLIEQGIIDDSVLGREWGGEKCD